MAPRLRSANAAASEEDPRIVERRMLAAANGQNVSANDSALLAFGPAGAISSNPNGQPEDEFEQEMTINDEIDPDELVKTMNPILIDRYIPKTTFEALNSQTADNPPIGLDATCSICLDYLKNGEQLRKIPICNHIFHADCLLSWLQVNEICPNCKNEVSLFTLRSYLDSLKSADKRPMKKMQPPKAGPSPPPARPLPPSTAPNCLPTTYSTLSRPQQVLQQHQPQQQPSPSQQPSPVVPLSPPLPSISPSINNLPNNPSKQGGSEREERREGEDGGKERGGGKGGSQRSIEAEDIG